MLHKINQWIIDMMVKTKFGMSRAIQVFLTLIAFWWAVILYLPQPAFETYIVYQYIATMIHQDLWATIFLLNGMFLLYGVIKDSRVILPSLMVSTIIWVFVGMVMLVSSPLTITSGTYVLIGLLSASTYFYEGVDRQ